jgi:Ni,Fe-hydrogenase III large subunit
LRGEKIVAVDPPASGFCRRGVEDLAAGKRIGEALQIVERSCSLAGHSHRTALCQAIEDATGAAPSARARLVRATFAETERALARLWTLGIAARAANLHAQFREAMEQREVLFDALAETTGERVFWGVAEPGGARTIEEAADLAALRGAVERLAPAAETWRVAAGPRGPLGRAGSGVGRIDGERASALELKGVVARAAGIRRDLRRDAPYGAYADIAFDWGAGDEQTPDSGDAAARMAVVAADLATSLRLARTLLDAVRGADDTSLVDGGKSAGGREGRAAVEGPHGEVRITATLAPDQTLARLRIQTPAAAVLGALPEILAGQSLELVPLVVASLDLCMECADL